MGNIGKQEALFELWYRVYQKAVQYKIGFITMYLTFLYTSFANLFCQNNVKKICKSDSLVFNKCDDMRRRKGYKDMIRTGDYDLPTGEISIYYCYNVNL